MYFVLLVFLIAFTNGVVDDEFCEVSSENVGCYSTPKQSLLNARYVFYDVNPPEGFNLRRDVYMRMAVFARNLKKKLGNWYLVLPPWPHLYHWQTEDITNQERLFWSNFFDVPSLAQFTPVLEMYEFLQAGQSIDEVFVLQHFEDTFTLGNFNDRLKIEPCLNPLKYQRTKQNSFSGFFWGYSNITARLVKCLSFHGGVSQLVDFIKQRNVKTIMFDHAEVALHDHFGDKTYWDVRKSMKFAKHLVEEADKYCSEHLQFGSDKLLPDKNVGGPYLCVHLRRKDFVRGRSKEVPTIKGAAMQILNYLRNSSLNTVFIATDAPQNEKDELKSYLRDKDVLMYEPSKTVMKRLKDGGVAIVEQIICSRARKFVGTHESTFSFRIEEEREILGFRPETTFSRLCGDNESKCQQPSQWKIVH